ncbi:DUF5689 domain-containing protein [Flavobacterium sp.]|uniref:DUF5689 domain-containing protein n=1 Tax=Flavobacterium sp. TaxID=239 RepID=UPI003D0A1718
MKNNLRNILGLTLVSSALMVSCVTDSFKDPENTCVETTLTKNKEVIDIYNAATATGTLYNNDDIIEAVVTSSDEGGNFFKTISLRSVDNKVGFSISIDDYNLYTQNYRPGTKVLIKLKGLYIMRPTGGAIGLVLGGVPGPPPFGTLQRLGATVYKNHVIPMCSSISEDNLVIKVAKLSDLNNDAYLNALVEVDNVQFENEGVPFGNNPIPDSNPDMNQNITDGFSSLVTRTSKFSNFAGTVLPSGRGKLRAVLTKFNSTYQLVFRTLRDIQLDKPRVDLFVPKVGNSLVYSATLNEPFTSFNDNTNTFPKYINDADYGPRYWSVKSNAGNKYIEMTSFAGRNIPGIPAKGLFIVPVDFTSANTLSFKKQVAFYRGGTPLKVYYIKATDYTAGAVVDRTKLVDITTSFNITYPAEGASDSGFGSVGTYSLPAALTGNGFFVFEYNGTTTQTSTLQIDDIVIN